MADGEEKAGIEFLFEFRLLASISRSMREASPVQSRSMPPGATLSLTRVCSSGWRAGRWRTRQACHGNRLVFAQEDGAGPPGRQLREEISRVVVNFGPPDLAPLARAVSDFSWLSIFAVPLFSNSFPGHRRRYEQETRLIKLIIIYSHNY